MRERGRERERERDRQTERECSIVPSAFIRVEAFVFVHMLNIYAY